MSDLFHFGSAAKSLDADDRYGSDGEMKKTQYIMQVLGFPGHPDTLKVLLTAAEKGIEVESAVVDMSTKQQDSDDYRQISPLGILPALKEADYVVAGENGASIFVEGRGLGRFLAPRNAGMLAQQNYWMDIGRTEVQPHVETLMQELVIGPMGDASYSADNAAVDAARAALATPLDAANAQLTKDFIVGDFCYVDIHWTAYVHLLSIIGEGALIDSRSNLKAWFGRIKVHKSYSGQDIKAYDVLPTLEDIKAKKLSDVHCGEF
jgi:glutathione S-transferase